MTTINQARRAVYDEFNDNYSPPYTPTVIFGNEAEDTEGLNEWLLLKLMNTDSEQHTLGKVGNRRYRRRGLVFIRIYTIVDDGLRRFDELARAARDIYEGKTVSGVWFTDGIIREIGPIDDKYVGTVSINCSWDETK